MSCNISFLTLITVLVCWTGPLNAQVTFDSNAAANNSNGPSSSVEVVVPTGNDRLLVALIGTDDLTNTPTVTYNSLTLTKASEATDNFNTTYDAKVFVYYLALGSGAAITSDIAVTGLDNYYTLGGMSFQNIDQSTPVKQTASAGIPTGVTNNGQIAVSLTGVTAGNLLFAFFGEDNVKQFDWGGIYIADNTHTDSGMDGAGYYYASYNLNATAGDPTFTYNINNSGQSCAGTLIEFAQKTAVQPTVSVAVAPVSATENSASTLDYTFTVNPAPSSDLTVNFTISGTAEDDDDFTVGTPGINNEVVNYTTKAGVGNNTGTIIIKSGQTRSNGQSVNNMMPYQAVNWCIALVGTFPSRD
ncbi:MAG: hypothetical protein AAF960_13035 [Bacteroidota bacterium]